MPHTVCPLWRGGEGGNAVSLVPGASFYHTSLKCVFYQWSTQGIDAGLIPEEAKWPEAEDTWYLCWDQSLGLVCSRKEYVSALRYGASGTEGWSRVIWVPDL